MEADGMEQLLAKDAKDASNHQKLEGARKRPLLDLQQDP